MGSTLLALRVIHGAFILTWFQFIFLLNFVHPPERPLPLAYPMALSLVAAVSTLTCLHLRKQLLYEPAELLASQPENQALLNRWRAGNILSFAFAETTMLLGVFLKFLGGGWKIVAIFFAAGLILQLLWAPRAR